MASNIAASMLNADTDEAIEQKTISVLLTPDTQENKPRLLDELGSLLLDRFNRLGQLSDLNRAIEHRDKGLLLTSDADPAKPSLLNNLGVSYRIRFEELGALPDLSQAIEYIASASRFIPDNHSHKSNILHDLGNLHRARFERLGELSDLDKATNYVAMAVLMTPDRHLDKPARLHSLGNLYRIRFERLGELADLSEAVEYLTEVVKLIPTGHPAKPSILHNLAASHRARFERIGEHLDLNKAIELLTEVASLVPEVQANKSGILSDLGDVYRTRFERLGDISDLNRANECTVEAVSLTPVGHPNRIMMLSNLGTLFLTRFRHLGELLDLNMAIEYAAEAALLVPDGHPCKSKMFADLGHSYVARFDRLQAQSDLDSAVVSFQTAAQSPTGPPDLRLEACRAWARVASPDSMQSPRLAYQQAIKLLPQVLWAGSPLSHRYSFLPEVANLTSEAVSHAISIGVYDLALEWFEEGHSTIWNQTAPIRLPLDAPFAQNPSLASQLEAVARELEHSRSQPSPTSVSGNNVMGINRDVTRDMQLALELDALSNHARVLPGSEDFLCPPKSSRLLRAADSHPIVIINTQKSRCDALILRPKSEVISHVSLPEFNFEKATTARQHIVALSKNRKSGFQQDEPNPLEKTLEDLWLSLVKPVLDFLGFTQILPIDELPRITWCTTGPLSFLPLHATGSYDHTQPNAFDLVISSYVPNLSTILARQTTTTNAHCSILGVGQEHTPSESNLPCTKDELAAVEKHAQSGLYLQLEGEEATVEQVLDAMDQFDWVHLACHGNQNPDDPMQSAFHLHDGDLTLAEITKRSFNKKGLAFLSACQTVLGDKNRLDEVVHLGTGMLMAGFPSVISTMWGIADEDGPLVADKVYAELLKDGEMDHTKAARALHHAVAHLREKAGEKAIARWASFIHIGA